MADEEYERRRWHFKKEISIGDLAAVALATAGVFTSYHMLEKRTSLTEKDVASLQAQIPQIAISQKAIDARQDDEALRTQARMDRALEEINRKLDRLMERGVPRGP